MKEYVLGIDQSTQGTKALLFDGEGRLLARTDLPHRQMIDEKGWVEHDPEEIYENTIKTVRNLIRQTGIEKGQIRTVGISNQRETALVWDKETGKPIYPAIVWQCARGAKICQRVEEQGYGALVRERTGLKLSPYFSAAKIAWVLEQVPGARQKAQEGKLCCGTIDSWLVYRLTGGRRFQTDFSNASRTQLFNIYEKRWDEELCGLFGIPSRCLARVTPSDGDFGDTDFEGILERKIPIRGVLGDSHGALFGQGCLKKGMIKATYGTGSSIMMNIGETPVRSQQVVTSIAWCMDGKINYVLEGNINYTGAVITWLKDDVGLLDTPSESEELARKADPEDETYLIPAFSGLGAPYWNSEARALICGMTRRTRRAEIVKAGVECIAYQITDVIGAMSQESGISIKELMVDGGPTKNGYLMQFQSDIAGILVQAPGQEELSGIGAAYAAGISAGVYQLESLFAGKDRKRYVPGMPEKIRRQKYLGWKKAVKQALR